MRSGRARAAVVRGETLAADNRYRLRAQMELAYFSGFAWLKQRQTGGAGIVLDDAMAGIYAALVLYTAGWFNLY